MNFSHLMYLRYVSTPSELATPSTQASTGKNMHNGKERRVFLEYPTNRH